MTNKSIKYKRVLLKLSGNIFSSNVSECIDSDIVNRLSDEIISISSLGVEVAIVLGGGNIIRGAELSHKNIGRATADYMGMFGTLINALFLKEILKSKGGSVKILTPISIQQVAEFYNIEKAKECLSNKEILILSMGTGSPYFTTDTAAALRAVELNANVLLKATKVEGVYSADPMTNKNAIKYSKLSYLQVLQNKLKIMDATAITLCMEYKIPIIVFNMKKNKNLYKIVKGNRIGTEIS